MKLNYCFFFHQSMFFFFFFFFSTGINSFTSGRKSNTFATSVGLIWHRDAELQVELENEGNVARAGFKKNVMCKWKKIYSDGRGWRWRRTSNPGINSHLCASEGGSEKKNK